MDNAIIGNGDSSLSLSLSPPLSLEKSSSISEHISVENDRSMQELEVTPLQWDDIAPNCISQEVKPGSMENSGSTIARSILGEILNNEQFRDCSEKNYEEQSLNIFANVDLDDQILYSLNRKTNELEELIALKDSTIAALNSELDSYREFRSNSLSLGTSTTDYKILHEDCQNKLLEFHNTIMYKDDLIQKLTESLHQSIQKREELEQKSDNFKKDIIQLQEQLKEASRLIDQHECLKNRNETIDFDTECIQFEDTLNLSQINLFNDLKSMIHIYIEQKVNDKKRFYEKEIDNLKIKIENEKVEHENEIIRLRDLLSNIKCGSSEILEFKQELDLKHSKEMEELRTYFEKKCQDFEKNYSEEIFSQQSRKLSNSSCGSDLPADLTPGPGGDTNFTPQLEKLEQDLVNLKQLIDGGGDFDVIRKHLEKSELFGLIRGDLRNKYNAELEILREDFDNKVDLINLDFSNKEEALKREIHRLKGQLNSQLCIIRQENGSSGEFEIDEVVQSYERRLQEQVTLAKIDIIAALQNQIQRLANSDNIDEDWPDELLKLKSKFEDKYRQEIENYENEISRLKRRSLNSDEIELIKERDYLKKQSTTLRNLVEKLLKYFNECENELNNTLVDEILKNGFDNSLSAIETELNRNRRFSLTPNFDDIINLVDDDNLESIESNLDQYLEKLRTDANTILTLTNNLKQTPKSNYESLIGQLTESRKYAKSLENDKNQLEIHLDQLLEKQQIVESELLKAQHKIYELIENGHREIISEGYGEEGDKRVEGFGAAVVILQDLQERARIVTENAKNADPNFIQMIEELARTGEKIVEEAKREREDLKMQIDAADKKYKVTCHFLEEQAAEREQERDDAQKEIDCLREQIRDRDKDKANCQRYNTEVENLELQLRELTNLMKDQERKLQDIDCERREAVDKIYDLREIIRDLEQQVDVKTKSEEELTVVVRELKGLIRPESKSPEFVDIHELRKHITSLENELQRLRLNNELVGNEGVVNQLRNNLSEFEISIDKKIRDLEGLHSTLSNTCCSSPSEDMSIRDVVNPVGPMSAVFNECEVPLQQLARLKEKLMRHSRAEDAAVKKIRDLEMQLGAFKSELDENHSEKEILKKQIADQLVLISSLQIRLDDQRIRAEHIEKQTNTSLECKIYDLQNTVAILEEKLRGKDKTIHQLNLIVEETQGRLNDQLNEMNAVRDDDIVIGMQKELEDLRQENVELKTKINENHILPNLVESIISDKNSDIGLLREKLSETEKQLEMYSSLNLDKTQLEALSKLRQSGISFIDMIDIDQARREEIESENLSHSLPYNRNHNETAMTGEFASSLNLPISPIFNRKNFTEIPKAGGKHVHFEDTIIKEELMRKSQEIQDLREKLTNLNELERKIEQLQVHLEETEETLKKTTNEFETELNHVRDEEKTIRLELIRKKVELKDVEEELRNCLNELDELRQFKHKNQNVDDTINEMKKELELKEAARNNKENQLEKLLDDKEIALQSTKEEIDKYYAQNEKMVDDLKRYEEQLSNFQAELEQNQKICSVKNAELIEIRTKSDDLNKEVNHLQNLLIEKDKVIVQMSEDSKSLHINLETIQAKLKETGNVVDLGRRLRDELKKNSDLLEEVHSLKAQLMNYEMNPKSIDEITGRVQKELDYSAYLDTTIINAVSDQSLSSLSDQDMEQLKKNFNKQKSINKHLSRSRNQLQKNFNELERQYGELKIDLEREKLNINTIQLEDRKLIEQLRIKLEVALENETQLEKILDGERKLRNELENQLKTTTNSKSDSTEYKDIPSKNSMELKQLKREFDKLKEDNESLMKQKIELENGLRYMKNLMETKLSEIKTLEEKIANSRLNEEKTSDELYQLKCQLDEKNREVENTRVLIEEIDQDRIVMKHQMDQLNNKLKKAQKETGNDDLVPQKLLNRIKEINEAVKDNKDMVELISRLTSEKKLLENRIIALENDSYAHMPFDDPESRANYLFAKYLRMDSYRKALVWQKRYLVSVLNTYPNSEIALSNEQTLKPQNRFKIAALVVISINRMRFMVTRWHSGKRMVKKSAQRLVQFQVGQPVSSQNFSAQTSTQNVDRSWTGNSPPSKEDKIKKANFKQSDPLTAPGLLKYLERVNQIQEKLGFALES